MREINTKKLFERIDWYCKDRQEGERSCQMNSGYTPPSNVADWLALNKSRPVDPPRERDYAKLTEAAKRKEAPFVDWNGPSSDPTIKHAGVRIEIHPAGCECTACAAPAHAPVADSAPKWYHDPQGGGLYCVRSKTDWSWYDRHGDKGTCDLAGAFYWCFQVSEANAADILESHGHAQVAAELRAKERKNVAARAWKYPSNGLTCLLIGDHGYTRSGKIGKWADAGKRGPCQGGYRSEIHDPAEIQRLVDELHAAGLGGMITPVL